MTARIDKLLDRIDTRALIAVLASIVGTTFLVSYLYFFKTPVGEFNQLGKLIEKTKINRDRQRQTDVYDILQTTTDEVAALRDQLYGKGEHIPANEMVPFIIGRLDRLSGGQNVQLRSVTPRPIQKVLMFEEIAFDLIVVGKFLDVVTWLRNVEDELNPMIVKQFDMLSTNTGGKLQTKLRIVSYRPAKGDSQ